MFEVVLRNLITEQIRKVVIITQVELNLKTQIAILKKNYDIEFDLIEINYTTEGPAASIKLAEPFIDFALPVVTANSDQYLHTEMVNFYNDLINSDASGTVLTMEDNDPKWSFVKLDEKGNIIEVREKQVISNIATVGIYGFKNGKLLFESIDKMIAEKNKVNNEYYIAPIYNYLIHDGHKINTYFTGHLSEVMFGLGVPEDYEKFVANPISIEAASKANRFGNIN
jgi:dTDP-glucose pyrophosphorylase